MEQELFESTKNLVLKKLVHSIFFRFLYYYGVLLFFKWMFVAASGMFFYHFILMFIGYYYIRGLINISKSIELYIDFKKVKQNENDNQKEETSI